MECILDHIVFGARFLPVYVVGYGLYGLARTPVAAMHLSGVWSWPALPVWIQKLVLYPNHWSTAFRMYSNHSAC